MAGLTMALFKTPAGVKPPPSMPYLNWVLPGVSQFLEKEKQWLPVLVEFAKGTTLGSFRDGKIKLPGSARIPSLFMDEFLPAECQFCMFFILLASAGSEEMAPVYETFLRAEIGPPVDLPAPQYGPFPPFRRATVAPGVQRVVTVVIDEGIAFAHPRFWRKPAVGGGPPRTRIEYIWVQDASGNLPYDIGMPGKEYTASQIDAEMAADENLPDGSVYTRLGVLDMVVDDYKPLAHRKSHGTHVLDLASGYDQDDPTIPDTEKPIIAIELPEISVGDPASSTLKPHAACGLVYALQRAFYLQQKGETLPVVANLSYGPHEGPHDGSSCFEQFVDFLVRFAETISLPLLPVFAAGNYRQSRVHASFRVEAGSTKALHWRLQPCGLTPSFMEIYFPAGSTVSVMLTPPVGVPLMRSTGDPANVPVPDMIDPPASVEFVDDGHALQSFMLAVGRTAPDPREDGHPVVPSGVWTVTVTAASGTSFDAWIKRSDTPPGRRAKGRQSYFDDADYQRFDPNGRPTEFDPPGGTSYVKRQNTLTGIATGRTPHVIGGFRRGPDRWDLMPSIYSSEASVVPVPGRTLPGVNWLAPSDDGVACWGTLAAGTHSAGRVLMSGTSVAAPQAVRYYVNEWARTGTRPGPMPWAVALYHVSPRVPPGDRAAVAGDGLMPLKPPQGHCWKDRDYSE
jgi:hypothetical protein